MFQIPEFTQIQRRSIYIIFASSIVVGGFFFSLAQGNASQTPRPIVSIAPITPAVPTPSTIVVDVAGKVVHPQIYTLPAGSRAADAILAAGGALKGSSLSDINLAHILVDGEQIIVGAPPVTLTSSNSKSKGSNGSKGGKSSTVIVNINTASAAQLEVLAGVGPVMAMKILAYRNAHGKFVAIIDLSKVSGFGSAKFAIVKSQLRI